MDLPPLGTFSKKLFFLTHLALVATQKNTDYYRWTVFTAENELSLDFLAVQISFNSLEWSRQSPARALARSLVYHEHEQALISTATSATN